MREMKDSMIEWCKSIPADWRVLRIKYIMYERREKTRTGEEEPLSVTQKYGIVKTKDIEVANPSVSYDDYIIVSRNDIVFNKYKAHSGVFFVTPYDGIVTFNYSVYRCYNGFNPKYYEYLFHTQGCIGEFKTRLHGVGESISPLYTKDLYSVTVFAPTFEEQNRIVTYLDSICAEINTTISDIEREIEALEEYKRSVITEAVTKGLDPDVEMRDSGVDYIGKMNAKWKLTKLRYICEKLNRYFTSDAEPLICSNKGEVFPRGENSFGLISDNDKMFQGVHKGDLLIHGMDTWHGAIAVSDYDGKCTTVVHVCDSEQNKYFISYFLQMLAFKSVYKAISNGVRENTSDFRSWDKAGHIYITIPDIDEQNRIAEYIKEKVEHINAVIAEKKQQIETIEEYKKSLIFEYVTGKKEVEI